MSPMEFHGALRSSMELYKPYGALIALWSLMSPMSPTPAVVASKALRGCRFPLRKAIGHFSKRVLFLARLGFGPCAALRQALRGSSLRRCIWSSLARLVFGRCAPCAASQGFCLGGIVLTEVVFHEILCIYILCVCIYICG